MLLFVVEEALLWEIAGVDSPSNSSLVVSGDATAAAEGRGREEDRCFVGGRGTLFED